MMMIHGARPIAEKSADSVVRTALTAGDVMLAMAMAALGATTHWSAIRKAGMGGLSLAAILFAWLLLGGAALNWLAMRLF